MDDLSDFSLVAKLDMPQTESGTADASQRMESQTGDSADLSSKEYQLLQKMSEMLENSLESLEERVSRRLGDEIAEKLKEKTSSYEKSVHYRILCDHCNTEIVGVRYKCGMCADYDLCESCEALRPHIPRTHIFMKIYEPLQQKCNKEPLLPQSLIAPISYGSSASSISEAVVGSLSTLLAASGVNGATLEVQQEEAISIRELKQANGSPFYISSGHLCRDVLVTNNTNQPIDAGSYRLQHIYSTGLVPRLSTVQLPTLGPCEASVVCLQWRLLNDKQNSGGMRCVSSLFHLKQNDGRRLGKSVTTSVVVLPPVVAKGANQVANDSKAIQTDPNNDYEWISDEELPECFILKSGQCSPANYELLPDFKSDSAKNHVKSLPADANACDESFNSSEAPETPRSPPNSEAHQDDTKADEGLAESLDLLCKALADVQQKQPESTETLAQNAQHQQQEMQQQQQEPQQQPQKPPKQMQQAHQQQWHQQQQLNHQQQWHQEQQLNQQQQQWTLQQRWHHKQHQWQHQQQQQQQRHQQQLLQKPWQSQWMPKQQAWMPKPMQWLPQQQQIQQEKAPETEREKLDKLVEMGFYRRELNTQILRSCNGNMESALSKLSDAYEQF